VWGAKYQIFFDEKDIFRRGACAAGGPAGARKSRPRCARPTQRWYVASSKRYLAFAEMKKISFSKHVQKNFFRNCYLAVGSRQRGNIIYSLPYQTFANAKTLT